MLPFKNGILLLSKSKKDFKLPETHIIQCFQNTFAIEPKRNFIYIAEMGIAVYSINPINKIKKVEYKKEIEQITAGRNCLYLLNNESLVLYSKNKFNVILGEFTGCGIMPMDSDRVGIQNKAILDIYDGSLTKVESYNCQCSFSSRDILIIGNVSMASVVIKGNKVLDISMPGYITSITTDPLFSKIFCATEDNNIYAFDLNGKPLLTLEYHEKPVKQMKLDFTGEHLYSSDGVRMCVWGVRDGTVRGYIDVEDGIESFEVVLIDEFTYENDSVLI